MNVPRVLPLIMMLALGICLGGNMRWLGLHGRAFPYFPRVSSKLVGDK